ncbi:MAG: YceI family protein [Deltaproteobacteria bacterium]|nr:YceI family protein [Deltaproteobacteria bacterium]
MKLLVLAMALALTACGGKKDDNKNKPAGSAQTGGSNSKPAGGSGDTKPAGGGSDTTAQAGSGSGDSKPAGGGSDTGSAAQAGSGSADAAPAADPNADFIEVLADHTEKKKEDPVVVKFEKFKVAKAAFDPAKIEGGTATIEVDLTSLKTGSDKRDGHLATKDYFDSGVAAFATMVIDVADVKKKGDDKHFTANATVKLHGVEKKLPVEFEVVDAKDDWIRVKGEHKVKRNDFKIGKTKDEPVADDLTFRMQLTLKKT